MVDVVTGKVIGIVTRKATGFIENTFTQILESFDHNIAFYRSTQTAGSVFMPGGINPIEALIIEQNQYPLRRSRERVARSAG